MTKFYHALLPTFIIKENNEYQLKFNGNAYVIFYIPSKFTDLHMKIRVKNNFQREEVPI